MKLTKQKLIALSKKDLSSLGYQYVTDSITAAQGLYIKKVDDSLFLSLGLTISRHFDNIFTASYYLSKTTTWAAVWGDMPNESYVRIGHFLTQEEREKLLDEQHSKIGIRDAWWDANDTNSLKYFFEAVSITESRFLSQPNLFDSVKNSVEIRNMDELAKGVISMVNSNSYEDALYKFIPLKPVDNIPIEWFKAAELMIKDRRAILNENTVKRVAADAYRQSIVTNVTSPNCP
ncbi:hypothetical protein [Mucilaginibacter sp. FT3.2]|uniref:hypothetical protein n=1 Tax=Mucilaginibacter sp. FT3.2 TaxID=2723090 RepID=UPI001619DAC7|nr:hypothetical protein [Mucilaginibacter sp. FT3.2]MBB6235387.1 hypothetical protein [Mucilaginibacter sp. FT3.2]